MPGWAALYAASIGAWALAAAMLIVPSTKRNMCPEGRLICMSAGLVAVALGCILGAISAAVSPNMWLTLIAIGGQIPLMLSWRMLSRWALPRIRKRTAIFSRALAIEAAKEHDARVKRIARETGMPPEFVSMLLAYGASGYVVINIAAPPIRNADDTAATDET